MPRFYFHLRDGHPIPDPIGTELEDVDAVRSAAVVFAGEAIRDLGEDFWSAEDWQLNVVDEVGAHVLTLEFSGRMGTDEP